jgi:hypothetical protein
MYVCNVCMYVCYVCMYVMYVYIYFFKYIYWNVHYIRLVILHAITFGVYRFFSFFTLCFDFYHLSFGLLLVNLLGTPKCLFRAVCSFL